MYVSNLLEILALKRVGGAAGRPYAVSNLLEILAAMFIGSDGLIDNAMQFQPFLRFWGPYGEGTEDKPEGFKPS